MNTVDDLISGRQTRSVHDIVDVAFFKLWLFLHLTPCQLLSFVLSSYLLANSITSMTLFRSGRQTRSVHEIVDGAFFKLCLVAGAVAVNSMSTSHIRPQLILASTFNEYSG